MSWVDRMKGCFRYGLVVAAAGAILALPLGAENANRGARVEGERMTEAELAHVRGATDPNPKGCNIFVDTSSCIGGDECAVAAEDDDGKAHCQLAATVYENVTFDDAEDAENNDMPKVTSTIVCAEQYLCLPDGANQPNHRRKSPMEPNECKPASGWDCQPCQKDTVGGPIEDPPDQPPWREKEYECVDP